VQLQSWINGRNDQSFHVQYYVNLSGRKTCVLKESSRTDEALPPIDDPEMEYEVPSTLSTSSIFIAEQIHRCDDAQSLADCLLHHGLEISRARLGNVQLMNWKAGYLEIKAQSGFGDEFLNFFKRVDVADVSACARALRKRSSIVIEDVTTDQQFAPCRGILTRAGYGRCSRRP
jgi:hypothetical protein